MHELANHRVTVMGLGRFGGGLGVTRWLASQGADILLTDLQTEQQLAEPVQALRDLIDSGALSLRLGGHNVSDFTTCDLVVANPAVPRPWDNRYLRAASAAAIPITTEIQLLIQRLPRHQRTIGITGSAGKSTTAAMIAHALRTCGCDARLGGNIGGSLLADLDTMRDDTFVVLELSSAMLHWIDNWSPHVAVVTNFMSGNHLDWHGSPDHYLHAKQRILRWQRPGDAAVLTGSAANWPTARGIRRIAVSDDATVDGLAIPGLHHQTNAALAVAACTALDPPGIDEPALRCALATFTGLPHRLQLLAEWNNVRFYNDSKSTTPDATLAAIDALTADRGGRVHLISGGYDKGAPLDSISALAPSLAGLYTIGTTGPALAAAASRNAMDCTTLEHAIGLIFTRLKPGDVVLLSPGCASWDQFANYEHRGERFAALVRERIPDAFRPRHPAAAP